MSSPVFGGAPTAARFRLVIAGCGAITANTHLPAALGSSLVELTALVDPDLDRARLLAESYGVHPRLCRSIQETFGEADGILIASPNHTHCELAATALEQGIPVLVEKPLARLPEEADKICAVSREKGVIAAVGFSTRFYPAVELMGALLRRGYFGRVKSLEYEYGTRGGWSPVSSYNLHRSQIGGGVLVITGSHFLDRVIHWFGYPEVLEYEDDSHGGPEANARGRLRFSTGNDGTFEARFLLSKTASLRNRIVLESDAGRCELAEGEGARIRLVPAGAEDAVLEFSRRESAGRARNAARAMIEDFVEAVRSNRKPRSDCHEGKLSVQLTAELYSRRKPLPETWMWYAERTAGRVA